MPRQSTFYPLRINWQKKLQAAEAAKQAGAGGSASQAEAKQDEGDVVDAEVHRSKKRQEVI